MGWIRNRYLLFADIILCILAYSAVIGLFFAIRDFQSQFMGSIYTIGLTTVIYCISLQLFRVYSIEWTRAGVRDYVVLGYACIVAAVISLIAEVFFINDAMFLKINFAANCVTTAFVCASRIFIRVIFDLVVLSKKSRDKRILIIGAGSLAISLIRNIQSSAKLDYDIAGLIDDDAEKLGMRIHGVRVVGNRNDIINVCDECGIDEIIFAINSVNPIQRTKILDICSKTGRKVKILPATEAVLKENNYVKQIREIDIEDLLEREPITLDNDLIQKDIEDKAVLVTGGGGSIGSELCRQILRYKPSRLIIFDIYENTTYEVQNELKEKFPDSCIDVLIGSVRDKKRLEEVFSQFRPEIVFHAAAHKHVPLMEESPREAIKNNVFGTYNTALCAEKYEARRFVMISTDKAVNPTNIMGATKRMCEMIVQTLQKNSKTDFVAVRFGNVLGSHGSVIPLFKKQIEEGGPVTVTHPEITRFFMTIPEAAQLVLQAAAYADGGEIFVLDMGMPVKIYDLACKLISLSGYVPEKDIEIKFTGLRPGEKLYEELLMNEEGIKETVHSKIFVGKPIDITEEELCEKLHLLEAALESDSDDAVRRIVSQVVPTYIMPEKKTNAYSKAV